MTYFSNDVVILQHIAQVEDRDNFLSDDNKVYTLFKGEIFDCTDHSTPDFMETINVFCKKRKLNFTLPIASIRKVNIDKENI